MPNNSEEIAWRRTVLSNPGEAHVAEDGRLFISFDGREVYIYEGPDFNTMTLDEINEHIARMDQE